MTKPSALLIRFSLISLINYLTAFYSAPFFLNFSVSLKDHMLTESCERTLKHFQIFFLCLLVCFHKTVSVYMPENFHCRTLQSYKKRTIMPGYLTVKSHIYSLTFLYFTVQKKSRVTCNLIKRTGKECCS